MNPVLAYITAKDKAEAAFLSDMLLKNRLAACVNTIEGIHSAYWWENKIEKSEEIILIAKTKESLKSELLEAVKKYHSYDCPCVLFIPVQGGSEAYIHWLVTETEKGKS